MPIADQKHDLVPASVRSPLSFIILASNWKMLCSMHIPYSLLPFLYKSIHFDHSASHFWVTGVKINLNSVVSPLFDSPDMLPLQASIRSAARSRCRPTSSATKSALSQGFLSVSSRSLNTLESSSQHATSSHTPRRSLHSGPRSLKDKRWVNSAGEEGKPTDAQRELEKSDEPEQEAESSKAAALRAKAAAQNVDSPASTVKASSSSSSSSAPPSSSSPSSPSSPSDSSPPDPPPSSTGREIAKLSIPDVYPQVLALPITHRPLFPTFYKAVTITSPPVIRAIRELLAHGQPYIGAFLFKDAESDADVITSLDQVHPVGVFAQITSSFESADKKKGEKDDAGQKALTVVLYPHRRIRIDELVTSAPGAPPVPMARVVEEVIKGEEDESEVSSFEKDVPSVDAVKEELRTVEEGSQSGTFLFLWGVTRLADVLQNHHRMRHLVRIHKSASSTDSFPRSPSQMFPTSSSILIGKTRR